MAKATKVDPGDRSQTIEADTVKATPKSGDKSKTAGTRGVAMRAQHSPPLTDEDVTEHEADSGDDEDEDVYEVEKLVGHKFDKRGNLLYQVRWQGYTAEDDTFEPEDNLLPAARNILAEYHESIGGLPQPPRKTQKRKPPAVASASASITSGETTETPPPPPKRHKRTTTTEMEVGESSDDQTKSHQQDGWVPKEANWDDLIDEVVTVERDENDNLRAHIKFKNGKHSVVARNIYYEHCPRKVLKFYEDHLSFHTNSP